MARTSTDALPVAVAPEDHRLAFAGLGVATFGWASAFVVGKIVLGEMTPLAIATWRYAIASLVLVPFALRTGAPSALRKAVSRSRAHAAGEMRRVMGHLAIMIVAGGVLYPWLFMGALQRTSATNTSLLIALNPVMTILLAPLVGEPFERRRISGAALAFAGALVVISGGHLARIAALDLNAGDVLAVVAAACWAGFNLASRSVVQRLAPSVANCAVYIGGFAALFALAAREDPVGQLVRATPTAIGGIAAMALLSSVLAGQLFLVGVRAAGVGRAVVFVYLVPVITALLSCTLLGEPFTAAQAVGGTVVLGGLWLATSAAASA
ncbi:MAG TPA: DMT family transporter [Candidatus Binatia bacterium]|nr:DMT family transporter [Candidatus Binatia bacterium]